ncbi:MAG: tetratricopeptide repeat protein, partial [Caulobacteraceae bacterium]|nr:tetratricopeptide repeat protein [Caulobacteraceae bacterium]
MALKANLRAVLAAICIAAVVAPSGYAEAPPATGEGGPLNIRVGQADGFSRIEFRFPGARITTRRQGQALIVHFSRYARPDMSRLSVDPPKWLKGASEAKAGGGLDLTLTLAEGADAREGAADGATYINLVPPPAPAAPAAAAAGATAAASSGAKPAAPAAPQPQRPNPAPDSGVVKMQAQMTNGQVMLRFPWKLPLGAAVFRRGEAVWVVFDAAAKLDLSAAPHGFRQVGAMQPVQGGDFIAVRIASPPDVGVSASAQGALWTVTFTPGDASMADGVHVSRDDASATPALTATVAGSTKVVWLDDPVVGDRIAAVTALAPAKGLRGQRDYVDLTLLGTAQGLALTTAREDLVVSTDGDLVGIGRPEGLSLSPKSAHPVDVATGPDLPQAGSRPGLINFDDWSRTGEGGFIARYDQLQGLAAAEVTGAKTDSVAARMGLARFLVGSELSFEAIGVLNMVANSHQDMLGNAEFRGLRGAARAMAGRYKEAQADFSSPVVADDPASSVWRGYAAAKLGQWQEAMAQFAQGASALYQFAPKWRARFARAWTQAALAQGQYPVADSAILTALSVDEDPIDEMSTRLVQAELYEAEGQKDRALHIFNALTYANEGFLAAPALLHATEIRLAQGRITPAVAADTYDSLRYRWRGDATELETIRALGQIYLSLGRYREALEALRSAGQRLPDLPEAVQLQTDLNNAFRSLFLDGLADGLQPIQALALFYDFKELTPVGADGDLMVRRLARRLVDVDLLSQAAELLKYQADNRLDGVPRAEVDTDLATIDLMNQRPEDALDAINASRTTLLPVSLSAQR